MNLRRALIGMTFCLLVPPCYANPYQPYPVPPAGIQQSPAVVLKQGIEQLTDFIASRGAPNTPPLDVFLENTIAPLFDFEYMAQWTAGAQARYMTPQQKAAMAQKLRRLFMAGMVEKLSEYRHGRVIFLRPTGNRQTGEVTLRLAAYQQGNPQPQRLSFRMYRSQRGWKVFDVSANGQSALAFYRTQFALEARQRTRPYYANHPAAGYPGRPYHRPRY